MSLGRYLFLMLFFFSFLFSKGQEHAIKVVDFKSNETIPYAHVCFEEINSDQKYYLVTNKDGIANIPGNRELIVAISFVGYRPYLDTVQLGKNYTFKLYPKVFDLDQAVVTASFVPQKADQSIYNVKVIDRRAIELTAANNLADIMSSIVNVKLNQDPALGTSLYLKGLSGNNVKILVDGVPVIGRVGGNIDISQLSLYNIDHIELIEGPLSVIYGSNALAGAINIITRENKYSKLTAKVNAYYETVGTYNVDAAMSSKIGKHGFSISGGRNFFSGYPGYDIQNVFYDQALNLKPKEQYNADLYYTFTAKDYKIKYQSSFMRERLLDKGELIAPQNYTAFDDWYISERLSNRVNYTQNIGENYKIDMLGSYSYFQRKNETYYKDYYQQTSNLVSVDATDFNSYVYRAMFGNTDNASLLFLSGVDLNYEAVEGDKITGNNKEIGDYAIFTSLTYNITNKLSFQPGVRYAYNTKFNVPLVPSINLKWSVLSNLVLRGSYARGYRAPTIKELYINFVDINHNILPNEDLKSEYGHNFDFTVKFNSEKDTKVHFSQIEGGLFFNRMHNIIELARREDESSNMIYQNINISNKNTLGGQISFNYSYYPFLDFSLGFGETGIYSTLDNTMASITDYKFSPDLNTSITNNIQKANLSLTLSYHYTGKSYLYMVNENDEVELSTKSDYHNLDFTVVSKFINQRLTLSAGVKNIFNNKTLDITGGSGVAHSSGGSALVGYGRFYFTRITYNIFK
jgi:outer membrane receptor for ferrienterochelin and colicins